MRQIEHCDYRDFTGFLPLRAQDADTTKDARQCCLAPF
jgi:hypothetical protein